MASKSKTFNPVKEDSNGLSDRYIWSTESLRLAVEALEQGKRLKANPFYENNIKLLKGDLVFDRTDAEIEEWKKCSDDIIGFANKYCKLMTPQGIQHITLRDYQEDYLEHLMDNRLSIFLSCRQSSKCSAYDTHLYIRTEDSLGLDEYRVKDNIYFVPFFELWNLKDDSWSWKIVYRLYKFLYKHNKKKKTACYTDLLNV